MPTKANPDDPVAALLGWQAESPVLRLRRTTKLSVRDFAALLDVSSSSVQNWESGTTAPDVPSMEKLIRLAHDDNFSEVIHAWFQSKPQV